MATSTSNQEIIVLADDTKIEVRRLTVSGLRRFMREYKKFGELDPGQDDYQDKEFDQFVRVAGVALERPLTKAQTFPKSFKFEVEEDGEDGPVKKISPDYKEFLEDNLDMDTIFKVIRVAADIDLQDPKLMEAASQLLAEAEPVGKTLTSQS